MQRFRDNIEIGNEKIAKFMGWFIEEDDNRAYPTWFEIVDGCRYVAYSTHNNYPHMDLPFHRDWNMLWKVIEKIEDLDPNDRVSHTYSIDICGNGTTAYNNWSSEKDRIIYRFNTHNNRLQNTFLVVVAFIDWYNEKEKNKENV
jgi:hypothetical protein